MSTTSPALQPLDSLDLYDEESLFDALQSRLSGLAEQTSVSSSDVNAVNNAVNALNRYATPVTPDSPIPTPAQTSPTPAPSTGSTFGQSLLNLIPGASGFTTPDFTRFIILILGIILFAAGLFAFKTTQTTIETVTSGAKRIAEIGG